MVDLHSNVDYQSDADESLPRTEAGGSGSDEDETQQQGLQKLKKLKNKKHLTETVDTKRINALLQIVTCATEYTYDHKDALWCRVTYKFNISDQKIDLASVIENLAKRAILHHTPGITRSFLVESKKPGEEGLRLKTEGVNIAEMYYYADILDLNQLYTNDIHAVQNRYGIEAACRVLIKEIRDVFAGYGIEVDYRHLSLIGDYMTFEGSYKPFNRVGIASNSSPLQKMTFETTMQFLKTAVLQGAQDDLKSPSSRITVGRLVGVGTGCFDLLQPS